MMFLFQFQVFVFVSEFMKYRLLKLVLAHPVNKAWTRHNKRRRTRDRCRTDAMLPVQKSFRGTPGAYRARTSVGRLG